MMGLVNFAIQKTGETQESAAIENVLLLALVVTTFTGLAMHFGMNWHVLSSGILNKLYAAQLDLQ